MILRYVVLCVHCTVINKLGLAGPEASPNCPLLSNNFLFKLYWTDRKNISPQLIPQTSVSLCCCHTILTAVVAVDSLTGLCCCCDFAVADSAAVAVRPEAEVGRDLLIIWCVGGGERERERERDYRQLHWYTLRAKRGCSIPASHWSESACCSLLIGQMCSCAGPSLGPGLLHTGPRVSCWPERNSDEALSLWATSYNFTKKNIQYCTISISSFPFLFHVTVINFMRFPLK